AMAILYRLAAIDMDAAAVWPAVLLLATYPFALYYSTVYTESLYLCALAGSFYAMKRQRFGWAALAGLAAGLTRPNGLWLTVSLVLCVFEMDSTGDRRMAGQRRAIAYAACVTPIIGAALYSLYLYVRFGDALAWLHGQAAWGLPLFGRQHAIEP